MWAVVALAAAALGVAIDWFDRRERQRSSSHRVSRRTLDKINRTYPHGS